MSDHKPQTSSLNMVRQEFHDIFRAFNRYLKIKFDHFRGITHLSSGKYNVGLLVMTKPLNSVTIETSKKITIKKHRSIHYPYTRQKKLHSNSSEEKKGQHPAPGRLPIKNNQFPSAPISLAKKKKKQNEGGLPFMTLSRHDSALEEAPSFETGTRAGADINRGGGGMRRLAANIGEMKVRARACRV